LLTLADFLRARRKDLSLTLRDVEQKTGLSNAYLSQVENGKIAQPSPSSLSKIAEAYNLSFGRLMELAGHPTATQTGKKTMVFRRLGRVEELTEDEEIELADYLTFLRTRRPKR
jgi:transcriptional regulator with XRE-family HTH domain